MSKKIHFTLEATPDGGVMADILLYDQKLVGKKASFSVQKFVKVKDSRPVHDSDVLTQLDFKIKSGKHQIKIPAKVIKSADSYPFSGKKITIECVAELKVDDSLILKDTTVIRNIAKYLPTGISRRASVNNNAKELIEPKDAFKFAKNLMAIPTENAILTIGLLVAGLILFVINLLIGIHDQVSPEYATWLYSHRDSDGDSNLPLGDALMGCGALGVAIWFAMRNQLRKYMTFRFKGTLRKVDRNSVVKVSDIIAGVSRVDLNKATLRIIACNMEKGQYVRGSGSNRRTVSFSEPSRAILLFSKKVNHIPKGQPVGSYFQDEFPFKPMFEALYPRQMITSTHGLDLCWEVQLILDDFVDQELHGNPDSFIQEDFYKS
jgi:hypothetical protein